MDIHYLKYKDINKAKWDASISNASIQLPYAYSWYLDTVCAQWDALVANDYQFVLPLPFNKKLFGKAQLYQPPFSQQLGIYSKEAITLDISRAFLEAIPPSFKYMDMSFNEEVAFKPFGKYSSYRKTNLVVDLNKKYEDLFNDYTNNHQRNVGKASRKDLRIEEGRDIDQLIGIYKTNQGGKVGLQNGDYQRLKKLLELLIAKQKGFIKNVYDSSNQLNLSMFFIQEKNRIVNIFGSNNELGKKNKAMYFMIDGLFKEYAGKEYVFDFEGSSIPGIAYFFKGFGAEKRFYQQVIYNELPTWVNTLLATRNWLKGN